MISIKSIHKRKSFGLWFSDFLLLFDLSLLLSLNLLEFQFSLLVSLFLNQFSCCGLRLRVWFAHSLCHLLLYLLLPVEKVYSEHTQQRLNELHTLSLFRRCIEPDIFFLVVLLVSGK